MTELERQRAVEEERMHYLREKEERAAHAEQMRRLEQEAAAQAE